MCICLCTVCVCTGSTFCWYGPIWESHLLAKIPQHGLHALAVSAENKFSDQLGNVGSQPLLIQYPDRPNLWKCGPFSPQKHIKNRQDYLYTSGRCGLLLVFVCVFYSIAIPCMVYWTTYAINKPSTIRVAKSASPMDGMGFFEVSIGMKARELVGEFRSLKNHGNFPKCQIGQAMLGLWLGQPEIRPY